MPDENTLSLTPDEMRQLGYSVIDTLVDHFSGLAQREVSRVVPRAELQRRLSYDITASGRPVTEVLNEIREDVFSSMAHLSHPRFFAFVPSPNNFVGVMAEALASGMNAFLGSWAVASGPAEIELIVIDWLRRMCGLPETAGGLFVSGGSIANLTALAAARHIQLADRIDHAVVYCSDQTHSSIDKALRVLGFLPTQLRRLPADEDYRLDLTLLERAVSEDRKAGLNPFCVVANAGTTNTGAVDPLARLVKFCREQELWLHADGAYGAPAMLSAEGREVLKGLGEADSISVDPHKWLFQPIGIGAVLLRDREHLKRTFHGLPEYLRDVKGSGDEINFRDYGIELTRGFRALKLWMSLAVFGETGFRTAVSHGIELAQLGEKCLRELADWEVKRAQLGIVAFRFAPRGRSDEEADEMNGRLVEALRLTGQAMISSTELRGRTMLRLCPINPRTTAADIRLTIQILDELAQQLVAKTT